MGSFCFQILLLLPHKTLRFYYVNVYRTICFFSASLSSRARVLVMMMNYWWNSFSSLPRRILFPSSIPLFYFMAAELLPGDWDLSADEADKSDSHLDYDVSIEWDSNYEFTISNGAVSGQMMEDAEPNANSAVPCDSQFYCRHQHESPEECYKIFSYVVCGKRKQEHRQRNIEHKQKTPMPSRKHRIASRALFFRGRCVWKWKLTGRIASACTRQHFSPFAFFKASLDSLLDFYIFVCLCCAHALNGLANVWEVRSPFWIMSSMRSILMCVMRLQTMPFFAGVVSTFSLIHAATLNDVYWAVAKRPNENDELDDETQRNTIANVNLSLTFNCILSPLCAHKLPSSSRTESSGKEKQI